MKTCLVTGGAGFIGSHTVDILLEHGYRVRVLDSLQPRVHPFGKPSWVPEEVEFQQGDVADRNDLEAALDGIDLVMHLAAYQDYMPDFSRFIHVNTESSALLFELIVANNLPVQKIVFASSQAVSGEGLYRCEEHGTVIPEPRPLSQLEAGDWEVKCPSCGRSMAPVRFDESTVSPSTAYGISKYAIELLADRLGRRYWIPTACMRYTYVQGSRNSFYNAYSGVARIFAMRLMHGKSPICFEDGGQLRDYINVRDVAEANLLVLEDDRADFGVFNVGGDRAVTVLEFARMMCAAFGSDLEPEVPGAFRVGDTRHTVSDISRLEALGWKPTVPVERNVEQYAEWIQQQPDVRDYFTGAESEMRASGVIREAGTKGR